MSHIWNAYEPVISAVSARIAPPLILLVAAVHVYIMFSVMFLWRSKGVHTSFLTMTARAADESAAIAANYGYTQGAFSGALLYGIRLGDFEVCEVVLMFIIASGVFGSLSIGGSSFVWVRVLPALLALMATELKRTTALHLIWPRLALFAGVVFATAVFGFIVGTREDVKTVLRDHQDRIKQQKMM